MGVRWLRDLLRDLAAEGRTVLVSSHQLAELAQTVDDVIVIDHGRLVARGPMRDLITQTASASLEELFLDLVRKDSVMNATLLRDRKLLTLRLPWVAPGIALAFSAGPGSASVLLLEGRAADRRLGRRAVGLPNRRGSS